MVKLYLFRPLIVFVALSLSVLLFDMLLEEFTSYRINNALGWMYFVFGVSCFVLYNLHLLKTLGDVEPKQKRHAIIHLLTIIVLLFFYLTIPYNILPSVVFSDSSSFIAILNFLITLITSTYLAGYSINLHRDGINILAKLHAGIAIVVTIGGSLLSSQIEIGYGALFYPIIGFVVLVFLVTTLIVFFRDKR